LLLPIVRIGAESEYPNCTVLFYSSWYNIRTEKCANQL